MNFGKEIIDWYKQNARALPWRVKPEPYKVWLSEIILQQTRVAQGLPYYIAFIDKYPIVEDLAAASEDEILRMWQGLGYYSRARNMHFTAKHIVNQLNARFPITFDELKKLKGVGDYTAAAIASICYGVSEPVVDGNVFRVLSRFLNDAADISSAEGKKRFKEAAKELLIDNPPGDFNQAMMELGALICTPKAPKCDDCPISTGCLAFSKKTVLSLPVKNKKVKIRKRYFHFAVIQSNDKVVIEKREHKDIWQNLYQFPLFESKTDAFAEDDLVAHFHLDKNNISIIAPQKTYKHQLSHQTIYAQFWKIKSTSTDNNIFDTRKLISWNEIDDHGVPRLIENYLAETREN